jgi:hypothetical protein
LVTKNKHFRGRKKHSFYFKQENLNKLLVFISSFHLDVANVEVE